LILVAQTSISKRLLITTSLLCVQLSHIALISCTDALLHMGPSVLRGWTEIPMIRSKRQETHLTSLITSLFYKSPSLLVTLLETNWVVCSSKKKIPSFVLLPVYFLFDTDRWTKGSFASLSPLSFCCQLVPLFVDSFLYLAKSSYYGPTPGLFLLTFNFYSFLSILFYPVKKIRIVNFYF
jgi:hypothetical protein